ncbi:hypothetical protein PCAR4_140136 [Paraburkholderia caribensis]|nr:hypothetical protein PCAR4_140136 [Paraburkholderia caribensis]
MTCNHAGWCFDQPDFTVRQIVHIAVSAFPGQIYQALRSGTVQACHTLIYYNSVWCGNRTRYSRRKRAGLPSPQGGIRPTPDIYAKQAEGSSRAQSRRTRRC